MGNMNSYPRLNVIGLMILNRELWLSIVIFTKEIIDFESQSNLVE